MPPNQHPTSEQAPLGSALPTSPGSTEEPGPAPGHLTSSAELNYLHRKHVFPRTDFNPPVATAGSFVVRLKRRVKAMLERWLLDDYLQAETAYQANLVRLLDSLSRAIDERKWRSDDELRSSLHTSEQRISASLHGSLGELERRLSSLSGKVEQHSADLAVLDSVARGLERIVASLGRPQAPADSGHAANGDAPPDYSYLLLENRYRGSESEISKRLRDYADLFPRGDSLPILEIGPGRGELQEVLIEAGVNTYGVETDAAMVERCRERGLSVVLENGLEHLAALDEQSLRGVVAVQVVEHLSHRQLELLLRLSSRKVAPGGYVVFETINTGSIVALTQNYFRDPTHAHPLHPETMRYLMELAGMDVQQIELRSAFGPEVLLQEVQTDAYMTPRWSAAVERINHNFKQLNDLLYGYQDYRIVGRVSAPGGNGPAA